MTNNFIDTTATLAIPLIEQFFQNPKNQAAFEKWLENRGEQSAQPSQEN